VDKITGYTYTKNPSLSYADIEDIFDRLETAQIEESPLGLTILGMTEIDWLVMKAMFGRNNGYPVLKSKVPVVVQIVDETYYEPKRTLLQRIKGWFKT
jgi:hypothetical protein